MEDSRGRDLNVKERSEMSGEGDRSGPTPLARALAEFLRKHDLEGEVAGQAALSRWDEVVGRRIAAVASPVAVARGVLYVEVRSSAWLSELDLMRKDILARINAGQREGRIERIVFRLAEDPDGPERD
jgi:predicted nucleic acid-binding Zn ribbon protein